MKKLVTILSLLCFFGSAFGQKPGSAGVSYDKFRDITTGVSGSAQSINIKGTDIVLFNAYYMFEGKTYVQPREGELIVEYGIEVRINRGVDECDEDDVEIRFLIDDKIVAPYYMHLGKTLKQSFGNVCVLSLNGGGAELIQMMANAKKVEAKIGSIEFELSLHTIDGLKTFYDSMPKLPKRLGVVHNEDRTRTELETYNRQVIKLKNAEDLVFQGQSYSKRNDPTVIDHQMIVLNVTSTKHMPEDDSPELEIYVDGKTIGSFETTKEKKESAASGQEVFYYLYKEAPLIIEKIAGANKVWCKLDKIEFELAPEAINQIKALYQETHKK